MKLSAICVAAVLLLAASFASAQTKDISEAKTACLINRGTNLETVDNVREKLQQWGRWKLVSKPEDADLLLILSDQEIAAGSISTANGYATGNSNYATGSSTAIGAPLVLQKVYLGAVDRQSGEIVTFVTATRRRHLISGLPAYLVSSLRGQIEKHERRGAR